ncbi:MAG: Ig-like domain-containing protein [Lachnospiraceae bacterium]|nr:Ig-like domain-containing protein [Lachnospiraceae bacterium]
MEFKKFFLILIMLMPLAIIQSEVCIYADSEKFDTDYIQNFDDNGKNDNSVDKEGIMVSEICYTVVYTGEPIDIDKLLDVYSISGRKLTKDVDYTLEYYDNVDIGTARVVITGIGRYTGVLTTIFKIVDKLDDEVNDKNNNSVDKEGIMVNEICYTVVYTGEPVNIDKLLDVYSISGKKLTKDVDYTLEYYDNVNIGTARVVITGIGGYTGVLTTIFKIVGKSDDGVLKDVITISSDKNAIYVKQSVKLKAEINGKVTSDVVWSSSNKSVAKVSSSGKITGVSKGTAIITVTSKSNKELKTEYKIKVNSYSSNVKSKSYIISTKDNFGFKNRFITSYSQMKKIIKQYSKSKNCDKKILNRLKSYNSSYFKEKALCLHTITQTKDKKVSVASVKKAMKSNGKFKITISIKPGTSKKDYKKGNMKRYQCFVEIPQSVANITDTVKVS